MDLPKDATVESKPSPQPEASKAAAAKRKVPLPEPEKPAIYTVASGLSICCARGIIPEGETISVDDLGGPPEQRQVHLDHLVATGAVNKS